MAWLRVGQASRVFQCLGVVIAVTAPGFLGHLLSNSDLGVNVYTKDSCSYLITLNASSLVAGIVTHQSIPAVPIPSQATAEHLLTLSVPGVGHLQFYRSPGGWALA